MKDLNFSNDWNTINVTYRTDMINATDQNFTIMDIIGLDDLDSSNNHGEKLLAIAFKRLPSNLTAFKDHATNNGLTLTISDSNGENSQVLHDAGSGS